MPPGPFAYISSRTMEIVQQVLAIEPTASALVWLVSAHMVDGSVDVKGVINSRFLEGNHLHLSDLGSTRQRFRKSLAILRSWRMLEHTKLSRSTDINQNASPPSRMAFIAEDRARRTRKSRAQPLILSIMYHDWVYPRIGVTDFTAGYILFLGERSRRLPLEILLHCRHLRSLAE